MQCGFRNAEFPVSMDTAITRPAIRMQSVTQSVVSITKFIGLVFVLVASQCRQPKVFRKNSINTMVSGENIVIAK
jgi:hypothetical protein